MLLSKLKNLSKIKKIIGSIFFITVFFCFLLINNLERAVSFIGNKFFQINLKIEDIELSFSKIKVDNLKIYDKKNRLMVDLPSVNFSYSLLKGELHKLELDSANIFIIKDKDGLNIKEVFEKDENKQKNDKDNKRKDSNREEENDKGEYQPKYLPIEDIEIKNLSINYLLEKNNEVKEKILKNININVQSEKKKGIEAKLIALDNKEKIELFYKNIEEPIYLELKLDNIYLEDYKEFLEDINPKLKKISGEIKSDAIISSKNKSGFIKLRNIEAYYSDIDSPIKVDVDVKLDRQNIDVITNYEIFGEKNEMNVTYREGEFYSLLKIKNIDEKKLSKIVPIKESKIDLSKIDIKDIILLIKYDLKNGFRLNFDLISNKIEYGAIKLDKIKVNLFMKDGTKTIEDSYIFFNIADMPAKLSLNGNITSDNKNVDAIFQIQNLDRTSNLIPDFNSTIKIINETDNIKTNFNSNIIKFNAEYYKKTKNISLYNEKFKLNYDNETKKLNGSGELEFSIYGLKNCIKYIIEESGEKINFDQIKVESEENTVKSLLAKGYYDLKNNDFNIEYDSKDVEVKRKYKGKDFNFSFAGKGNFKKIRDILTGTGNIDGLNLHFLGDLKSLIGQYNLSLNEKKELELDFNGKIKELAYEGYKIKEILINLGFKNDILNIKQIGNKQFNLNGKFDKETQNTDIKISIDNLKNKDLDFDKLDFNIKDVKADIRGNLKNPIVNLNIKNIEFFILDNITKFNGNIKMKDKKINISDIKLNRNKLIGNYDLETKKYNVNIVIDENLSNYVKDLNYKLNGLIKLNGLDGKLNSELSLKGNGTLKDNALPNLNLKANYSAKNYLDGILKVETLALKNINNKNLIDLKGDVNLKTKFLNLKSNESFDISDLQEYTKNNDIKGKFNLNIVLDGKLDKPEYNFNLSSKELLLKNLKLNNINSKLIGNKKSLNIEDFSFEYLNNKFIGNGKYNISNKDYDFRFKSSEIIKLSSFADSLKNSDIKEINGLLDINLAINKNGLNGYFKANDIMLKDKKSYFNLNNLNINLLLENNELITKEFSGKINDGNLKVDAYTKIPKDFKNIADSIIYYFNLDAQNIKYDNPEIAEISFNSQIKINNKEIDGNIIVNRGHIYDIPNDYKSLWSIISKKILNKKADNKKADTVVRDKNKDIDKKKYEEVLKRWDRIKIKLLTREPIILDLEDFNIVVGELKGKLITDLELTGEKGKLNLLGHTEILNGHLYVNTNKFTLDRALVSFNDKRNYIPEINPDIFLDTRVMMDDEEINFSVHGRPKKLIYSLSSNSGNIRGDFNSLLINSEKELNFDGDVNQIYINFMKNIIAGQIVQTIFSPITKTTKKILKLSKLQIKPEVSVYNVDSRVNQANNQGRNLEVYDFGMTVEVEKEIYKDKIYLYGNARLFGSDKDPKVNSSLEKHGVKEYDVGAEYRTKDDKIFGVGVGTVSNRYVNEERNQKKRNYHIDFKIRKKYDSFGELLSF